MSGVQALNLPNAPLKLSKKEGRLYVWCVVRKKHLLVTPEEWVRQHVIHYFLNTFNVPLGRIASEYTITVNQLVRRCDLVIHNAQGKPTIIVECKAPEVALTEKTFLQVAHYNRELQVEFLFFSNGLQHIGCRVDYETGAIQYLEDHSEMWEE